MAQALDICLMAQPTKEDHDFYSRDGGRAADSLAAMRKKLTASDERTILYGVLNKASAKDAEAWMILRTRSLSFIDNNGLNGLRQGDMVFFGNEKTLYYFISRNENTLELETYPLRERVPMAVTLDKDMPMYVIPLGRAVADAQNRDGGTDLHNEAAILLEFIKTYTGDRKSVV